MTVIEWLEHLEAEGLGPEFEDASRNEAHLISLARLAERMQGYALNGEGWCRWCAGPKRSHTPSCMVGEYDRIAKEIASA